MTLSEWFGIVLLLTATIGFLLFLCTCYRYRTRRWRYLQNNQRMFGTDGGDGSGKAPFTENAQTLSNPEYRVPDVDPNFGSEDDFNNLRPNGLLHKGSEAISTYGSNLPISSFDDEASTSAAYCRKRNEHGFDGLYEEQVESDCGIWATTGLNFGNTALQSMPSTSVEMNIRPRSERPNYSNPTLNEYFSKFEKPFGRLDNSHFTPITVAQRSPTATQHQNINERSSRDEGSTSSVSTILTVIDSSSPRRPRSSHSLDQDGSTRPSTTGSGTTQRPSTSKSIELRTYPEVLARFRAANSVDVVLHSVDERVEKPQLQTTDVAAGYFAPERRKSTQTSIRRPISGGSDNSIKVFRTQNSTALASLTDIEREFRPRPSATILPWNG